MKKASENETVTVSEIHMTEMRFNIVGTTPLLLHAMSFKSQGGLLYPAPKKNAAEKATTMKHEPYQEFRDAAYKFRDEDETPTRLYMPAGSVHGAMKSVAVDMVGAKKAQIGRLVSVPGMKLSVFGVPQIWSGIVRSSDMARTPDIRFLPIVPKWAMPGVIVRFVGSLIKETSIANLLANAGIIVGIGDGRPEKGKLTMGCFRLAADDDKELQAIIKAGGRAAQDKALQEPGYYDLETEKLLDWFEKERARRVAGPPRSVVRSLRQNPRKPSNNTTGRDLM